MPDPQLKAAMSEIRGILRDRDIAAHVVLASKTHLEYLREFETSWTALKPERDSNQNLIGIRFRCKRDDYATEEEWRETMRLTIGTILGFVDALNSDCKVFMALIRQLPDTMVIEHMTKDEPLDDEPPATNFPR